MQLIGLSGAARSGKDTVGKYLVENHNFKRYAFADPLKRAASEMFGIPFDDFVNDDRKEVVNEFWGYSPRQIAQLLGTEGGRELFREDIWVKRAEKAWLEHKSYIEDTVISTFGDVPPGTAGMVITDVRFPNEAQWVKDMGGLVVDIMRPGADGNVGVAKHASEAGYPEELKDIVIVNDGTLDQLYEMIDRIFTKVAA